MSVDKEAETTNLVAAFAGQMTYSINSSEINTRLYDFRAKKRKIRSGIRKRPGENISPEKLEMGTRKKNRNKLVCTLLLHFNNFFSGFLVSNHKWIAYAEKTFCL